MLSRCCGAELSPRYDSEPFTMHTPIGSSLRSWLRCWACPECGLMYDHAVLKLPDPREEARQRAELEAQAERTRRIRESLERDFDAAKLREGVAQMRAAITAGLQGESE